MIAVLVKGRPGPPVTVLALVIFFAMYAFIAAGLKAVRTFSSAKAGPSPAPPREPGHTMTT